MSMVAEIVTALFHKSKKHQITTVIVIMFYRNYCFTNQKSIKSQHNGSVEDFRDTVSQIKKASNHNPNWRITARSSTVSQIKKASNHNKSGLLVSAVRLFHKSKKHQITTSRSTSCRCPHCFTNQKSIKSQPRRLRVCPNWTVSQIKKASNHNTPFLS